MERINSRARVRGSGIYLSLIMAVTALGVSACGSSQNGGASMGDGARRADLGTADQEATSSDTLNVAVRYVSYQNDSGQVVASQSQVQSAIDEMSQIWNQCNIRFSMTHYDTVKPGSMGARYNPANYSELDAVRQALQETNDATFIGTGTWDRTGDLGSSGSNCYSSFPGDAAQGITCEYSQAASGIMFSHEIGHWMDLYHTDDPSTQPIADVTTRNNLYNLMKHFVSPSNTSLTRGQCEHARWAIVKYRRGTVM